MCTHTQVKNSQSKKLYNINDNYNNIIIYCFRDAILVVGFRTKRGGENDKGSLEHK